MAQLKLGTLLSSLKCFYVDGKLAVVAEADISESKLPQYAPATRSLITSLLLLDPIAKGVKGLRTRMYKYRLNSPAVSLRP